ncbi:MAG: hypothetical protein U0805_21075 [Pirellulales bacterium]
MTTATLDDRPTTIMQSIGATWEPPQPANNDLRLPIEPTIDPGKPLAKKIETYLADSRQWEGDVATLHAKRDELLRNQKNRISEAMAAGDRLQTDRDALAQRLIGLLWSRMALIPELIKPHQNAVERARQEVETVIAMELARFASYGVTPETTPAGQLGQFDVAADQLRNKARQELSVMAIEAWFYRCECGFEAIKGSFGTPPMLEQIRIDWQPPASESERRIAALAGVDQPYVCTPVNLSGRASIVAQRIGLGKSPLLREHVSTIEALATAAAEYEIGFFGLGDYWSVGGKPREQMDTLLLQLPMTREIKNYVQGV